MKATKNIDIYLIGKRPVKVIDVVQYDTGIQLVFTVKDFTIPSGANATLYVQKSSGKFVYQKDNITVSGNTITVDLENQALTEHGRIPYQMTISSGSDTVTSFAGVMLVERSLKDAGAVESKTVQKAFDKLTAEKLEEFQTNAETVVNAEIATIPDDYTELSAKVNESANAIKGKLLGAVVTADDVSPLEHEMAVEVHSKNRWTTDLTYPTKNIEYDALTQVYTFNGVTNATLYTLPKPIPKGTTVTITAYVLSGKVTSLGDGGLAFGGYYKEGTDASWQGYINIPKMTNTDIAGRVYSQTVETTEEVTHFYAFIYASSAEIHEPLKVKFQYEIGDTATEYTPYVDPSTVTVTRCGKNIYKVAAKTQTINGVTFTVNDDGSVTANGTATKATFLGLGSVNVKVDEKYHLSGSPSGSGFDTYMLYIHNNTTGADIYDLGEGKVFTGKEGDMGLTIVIYANTTVNNLVFHPMVICGEASGSFEPYNGTEYIPTSDGVVSGVTSLSPNMTLLTDTEGVIVECEYNKDTNKVIQKLANALSITI